MKQETQARGARSILSQSGSCTDEFSFILRPSQVSGVGVFALHAIAKDTWLEVFPRGYRARKFRSNELPAALRTYCTAKGRDIYAAPQQFNRMYIGWYMNHSADPNVTWDDDLDGFVASRYIECNEELLIDYNVFEEPEYAKDAYYRTGG